MSTNYYLQTIDSATGKKSETHVALWSAGLYKFHAHPDQRIESFKDWSDRLRDPDSIFLDEYDAPIDVEEFLAKVLVNSKVALANLKLAEYHNSPQLQKGQSPVPGGGYRDADGVLMLDWNFS